jgi:hypothetical protein
MFGTSVETPTSGVCERIPAGKQSWQESTNLRKAIEGLPSVIPGIIDTAMLRSCFGADAGNYPAPAAWAEKAVPFLLSLGPKDNGKTVETLVHVHSGHDRVGRNGAMPCGAMG